VGASLGTGIWGVLTTLMHFPPAVATAVASLAGLLELGQSIKTKWDSDRNSRHRRRADDVEETRDAD
jgi:hypothetical protein